MKPWGIVEAWKSRPVAKLIPFSSSLGLVYLVAEFMTPQKPYTSNFVETINEGKTELYEDNGGAPWGGTGKQIFLIG